MGREVIATRPKWVLPVHIFAIATMAGFLSCVAWLSFRPGGWLSESEVPKPHGKCNRLFFAKKICVNKAIIIPASRVALRRGTLFADTSAYGEKVNWRELKL